VVVSDFVPQTLEKIKASPLEVLEIGIKLGECLYRFLQNGFIYTDFKPSNVGITADFNTLVLDIGGFKNLQRLEMKNNPKRRKSLQIPSKLKSSKLLLKWRKRKLKHNNRKQLRKPLQRA
jgi:hypothetical protein